MRGKPRCSSSLRPRKTTSRAACGDGREPGSGDPGRRCRSRARRLVLGVDESDGARAACPVDGQVLGGTGRRSVGGDRVRAARRWVPADIRRASGTACGNSRPHLGPTAAGRRGCRRCRGLRGNRPSRLGSCGPPANDGPIPSWSARNAATTASVAHIPGPPGRCECRRRRHLRAAAHGTCSSPGVCRGHDSGARGGAWSIPAPVSARPG